MKDSKLSTELQKLYSVKSKHSAYQSLPAAIAGMLGINLSINTWDTRSENERLRYIKKHLDLTGKKVIDIGGNTGFFTFESIDLGASAVRYYEGNKEHALFVETAAKELGLSDMVDVQSKYFLFEQDIISERFDVCFCLNVVHHLGDDFGDQEIDIQTAKDVMIKSINSLASRCEILVFQMGFNWKGDIKLPLFKDGTKIEMIEFIKDGTKKFFNFLHCGIATGTRNEVEYQDLCNSNSIRNDELGEFLNRPIFIMSTKYHSFVNEVTVGQIE